MTPDISLNGLVYWLAYDKKHESCPTVIPPVSALMAPKIPTPAYTRLLTKRVHGFVRLEKNVALSEHFCNLSFISSNCSSASSSWLKACTTFSFPTISSMSDVCSPLVLVCSWNMEYVFLVIKLATKSDRGVMSTTIHDIFTSIVSMKISVPAIVAIPVKSCVKPIKSPSENVSTSAMIRLTISPCEWLSI